MHNSGTNTGSGMRPLPLVWPYWVVFLGVFAWAFAIESRFLRKATSSESSNVKVDAGSMWAVVVGNWLSMVLATVVAFGVPSATLPNQVLVFWIGIAVLIAGSLLRRHCFRMLGQYFTYDVRVRTEQPVIERGAYRWVRHPSYSAGILMFLGMGLALGNWISVVILLGTIIGVYAYRVRIEERALLATMGNRYAQYMRRTRRFVPFLI
jgi:protein-S-isoprenylcysteine O-methyltransferase Ste14